MVITRLFGRAGSGSAAALSHVVVPTNRVLERDGANLDGFTIRFDQGAALDRAFSSAQKPKSPLRHFFEPGQPY